MDHSLVCRTFTYMFYKTIWQMSHKRPSWLECLCMGFECFPWVLLLELDVVFLCNCLYLSFSSVINWGTVNFAMTKSQVVWCQSPPLQVMFLHPESGFYILPPTWEILFFACQNLHKIHSTNGNTSTVSQLQPVLCLWGWMGVWHVENNTRFLKAKRNWCVC